MTKIGLFGGAFDPPTIGHLETAKQVLAQAPDISEVWLLPCNNHQFGKNMTSADHRLQMCELASEEIPGLFVCDFEIDGERDGASFNTIAAITSDPRFKQHCFAWIIGADNALVFEKWYRHDELKDLVQFIVVPRPGYDINEIPAPMLSSVQDHRIVGQDTMQISSTKVRELLQSGQYNEAQKWVTPTIFKYIVENGLYGTTDEN